MKTNKYFMKKNTNKYYMRTNKYYIRINIDYDLDTLYIGE